MTRQSVTVSDRQEKMTKFGYPSSSVMSREPTRIVGLARDSTKIIALNREATKYNGLTNNDRVRPIINNRRGERGEKKWPLRGWEVENCTDDGIVAWTKRQSQIGGKKGTKKKTIPSEEEYVVPPSNRCPCLDDLDLFVKQSLHSRFLPKEQLSTNKAKSVPVKDTRQYIKPETVNNGNDKEGKECGVGVGVITPVGYTERVDEVKDDSTDRAKVEINNYKEAKANGTEEGIVRERRSRSVPENHSKHSRDKADQRSTAYHKIKRFLKLSKYDDRRLSTKLEEDEDEGYASKTSSAEAKEGSSSDSEVPGLRRMYSSMIDLSELPSNEKKGEEKGKEEPENKVKFSYTHQPSILRIPADDTKVQLQRDRPERIDHSKTYTRLKREKELRRCNTTLCEPQHILETSTMYNIDSMKPMTLVLRKISIQDSEQRITAIIPGDKLPLQANESVAQSLPNSRANSRASSRAGSTPSRSGSAMSRPGSVMSRSGAQDKSPRYPSRPSSRLSMRGSYGKENISTSNSLKTKEPTWCPKHSHVSLFDRQATAYSIGDLLPAVDKSIYNKQITKGSDTPRKNTEHKTIDTKHQEQTKQSQEDGYMLLQKGMDILTGSVEKPTLGPPPFRANQSRHPLIRNVTVVVEQSEQFSPIHVGNRAKAPSPQTRISSDKGPRPNMYEDKETQKKLKEAFAKFYQNRPKDIGKEFRRMQTMWKV